MTEMPTGVTFTVQSDGCAKYKLHYRAPLSERLTVWLRNLWNWRTAWAVRYLSKQLQRDKEFRDAWQANIAMPIYDATRPTCHCAEFHCSICKADDHCEHSCHDAKFKQGWLREMPADQCNVIADRLMKHLFNA